MRQDKVEALEVFIGDIEEQLQSFISNTSYLREDLKGDERDEVIRIITDKIEGAKQATSKKELKKYVSIDNIMSIYGIGDDDE